MQIWVKNVTRAWADVAEKLAAPPFVNLWSIDRRRSAGQPSRGDLVLFRLEDRHREIVGYGTFVRTITAEPEEIWSFCHLLNGAWTGEDFLAQTDGRRRRASNDRRLANAIIAAPVFFPPLNPLILQAAFPMVRTTVPLCLGSGRRGRVLIDSLRHHASRTAATAEPAQARLLGPALYRIRRTDRTRRRWRILLRKLSDHRCAMTGERLPEIQDVIHVWPLAFGGPDTLANLMLLEVALHRLWDRGLISVDEDRCIMVSAQLRLSRDARRFLKLAGRPLRPRVLGAPYPDDGYFHWHREVLFRGPALKPRSTPSPA